ncbi:MAG TPA: N-6 DNA methylase [Saprospiraceae bacterium]|nr:N-6 DNA methylase [Saprospiraceae bacterium]
MHECSERVFRGRGQHSAQAHRDDADLAELHFVKHMLDCLEKGGTGIAIVPMSCAIAPHPARVELLKQHTLEAVMSMPDELFYPVGTVTCIIVLTAKIPHATSNKKPDLDIGRMTVL